VRQGNCKGAATTDYLLVLVILAYMGTQALKHCVIPWKGHGVWEKRRQNYCICSLILSSVQYLSDYHGTWDLFKPTQLIKIKVKISVCLQKFQRFVGHHLGHIKPADAALLPVHNFLGNSSCMGKEVLWHTMVGSILCNFLYLPTWNILCVFKCRSGKSSFKSQYSFWQHDLLSIDDVQKKVW
jgi:hypothetical protein